MKPRFTPRVQVNHEHIQSALPGTPDSLRKSLGNTAFTQLSNHGTSSRVPPSRLPVYIYRAQINPVPPRPPLSHHTNNAPNARSVSPRSICRIFSSPRKGPEGAGGTSTHVNKKGRRVHILLTEKRKEPFRPQTYPCFFDAKY